MSIVSNYDQDDDEIAHANFQNSRAVQSAHKSNIKARVPLLST